MDNSTTNLRKLVPVRAVVVLAVIGLCVLALSLAGRDLLQQGLWQISRASAEAKPFVDPSSPVVPWERDLYEKYRQKQIANSELELELSRAWGIDLNEEDANAWIARMNIYANFLDVFGLLLYFPGPMWFRVAWELYGETALLLAAILFAASRTENIHFRHAAIISSAGLVVFSSLVSAPARHSVLGSDIVKNPMGWNFNEWYLRYSLWKWGEIPLWFRYKYSGSPYLGDPQMIVYYPSTIILALAPNEMVGIRYAILLHTIMSGISMYFLMNVWRQKPEASLVAGIGYMLGGFTYAKIQAGYPTFIYPYAWMPLVLAFLEISLRRRSIGYAALAGLSLGMQVQSGIIMALYTVILLGLYGLYKVCITLARDARRPRELLRHARETAKLLIVFTILIALISASKILPTLEALPYLDRGAPLVEEEMFRGVIPDLSQLIQVFTFRPWGLENLDLVFPAWGAKPLPYHWYEYWSYTGLLLPLAICSLWFVRRNGVAVFLAITTILSALWSMGILYEPLLEIVPFLSFTRVPSRLLVLAQFSIPALAAITVTNVQAWLANRSNGCHHNGKLGRLSPDKVFALLVATLVFIDLATCGVGLVRTIDVRPILSPAMKYATQDLTEDVFRVYTIIGGRPPNVYTCSVNGLETTWLSAAPDLSYSSWEFSINAYSRYHQLAQTNLSYKMMGLLNVKYVIADTSQEASHGLDLVRTFGEEGVVKELLYSNRYYLNRIEYVEHGLLVVCQDDSRWEDISTTTLLKQAFDPIGLLVVRGTYLDDFTLDDLKRFSVIQIADESRIPARNSSKATELLENYASGGGIVIQTDETVPDPVLEKLRSKSGTIQVSITRYTANSLEANVVSENNGFAFISEVYFPGWRIYVDGREARVLQVNDIFIGVPLDAGTHSLRVEFKPYSYDFGVALTILGFVGAIVLLSKRRIKAILAKLPSSSHAEEVRVWAVPNERGRKLG